MRFEFTRPQRREIHKRANGRCEVCGAHLKIGEGEYDHRIAQGYGGDNTVENGQLLCVPCHKPKTALDKAMTEKVKRIHDKHVGIYPPSRSPLRSRGFSKTRLWEPSGNEDNVENSD